MRITQLDWWLKPRALGMDAGEWLIAACILLSLLMIFGGSSCQCRVSIQIKDSPQQEATR